MARIRDPEAPLARAQKALGKVEEIGDLEGDDLLQAEARGINLGAMQRQYMLHAATFALVSIADSLDALLAIERDKR